MGIETIAGSALVKAIQKAWKRDRDHRYRLNQPWSLPRLVELVPDYHGRYVTIEDSVITVQPSDVCDGATLAICQLGGIEPPVTKFEDASPIQAVYEGIMSQIPGTQDPSAILGLLAQASQVQAHAQTIQLCIMELRRADGDDAWERIPDSLD